MVLYNKTNLKIAIFQFNTIVIIINIYELF